jgi:hypothetical protein
MIEEVDCLPFESYIHSCYEKEYMKDVKKKQFFKQYMSLLMLDHNDAVSLKKFGIQMMFFRNVFTKEACLQFFLDSFEKKEKDLLSYVVFDMIVRSNKGVIGEHKQFYDYSLKLLKVIKYNSPLLENWEKVKQDMPDIV